MSLSRNRLCLLLTLACLAGYGWLLFNYLFPAKGEATSVCLIRYVTNIPCPSCGSTRSVIALVNGHWFEAFYWNPIGLLLALIMVVAPLWMSYDWTVRRDSMWMVYIRIEAKLRQKYIALPAISLVLVLWIWNIYKGL